MKISPVTKKRLLSCAAVTGVALSACQQQYQPTAGAPLAPPETRPPVSDKEKPKQLLPGRYIIKP